MGQQESKAGTGARDDRKVQEPPGQCKRFACDVQECLAHSNYQQSRCQKEIDTLNECVKRYYEHQQQQQQRTTTTPTTTTTTTTK